MRNISLEIDLFAYSATGRQSGRPFRSFSVPPLFGPDSDSSISPDPINHSHGISVSNNLFCNCISPCESMLLAVNLVVKPGRSIRSTLDLKVRKVPKANREVYWPETR